MNRLTALRSPTGFCLAVAACGLLLGGCKRAAAPARANARTPTSAAQTLAAVQAARTNATVALSLRFAQIPRSTFSTNLDAGRDPFFPESTRRLPKAAVAAKAPSAPTTAPVAAQLKLTGLWASKNQSLALINKTTFAPGDEAHVTVTVPAGPSKTETRKVLVRCLEIRSASVVVSVEGEPGTKELPLQARL